MDVDARLEAVEAENDMLRAKVAQLQEMLGFSQPVPLVFGLTPQEANLFSFLMKRDLVTKEAAMEALYGHRPEIDVEIKIVDVFICKIRKKITAHDVKISTVWGRGYRLAPESKVIVRALIEAEGT